MDRSTKTLAAKVESILDKVWHDGASLSGGSMLQYDFMTVEEGTKAIMALFEADKQLTDLAHNLTSH